MDFLNLLKQLLGLFQAQGGANKGGSPGGAMQGGWMQNQAPLSLGSSGPNLTSAFSTANQGGRGSAGTAGIPGLLSAQQYMNRDVPPLSSNTPTRAQLQAGAGSIPPGLLLQILKGAGY